MKRRTLKLFLYALALLVFFELSFRVFLALPWLEGRLLWNEDLSWRRLWVQRQRRGVDTVYSHDRYDPTKGWVAAPGLRDLPVFDGKRLSTNRRGWRGSIDYGQKSLGTTRIVVVGDSFTFGDEVSDDETYCHYLQASLPRTEVVNLGMHGYGHDQMLIALREEAADYEPDIVLLGFVTEDMDRNLLGFRDYAKPRFVLDDKTLRLVGSPVPPPEEILRRDWLRPRLYDVSSILYHVVRRRAGLTQRDKQSLTRALLNEMASVAAGIPARAVWVYLPTGAEIGARREPPGEVFLFDICARRRDVDCFSVVPAFTDAQTQGLRLKTTGHWDALGHSVAAQAIGEFLVQRGYVPDAVAPPPRPARASPNSVR